MVDIILNNFDNPDEIRNFDKGKLELVNTKRRRFILCTTRTS